MKKYPGQPVAPIAGFNDTVGSFGNRLLTGIREWLSNAANYLATEMRLLPVELDGKRYATAGHNGTAFASVAEIFEKGLRFLGTAREGSALNGIGLKIAASRLCWPETELIVGSKIDGKLHVGRGFYDERSRMWLVEDATDTWAGNIQTLFGAEFDNFNVFYAMRVDDNSNLFPVGRMIDLPFMCDFVGKIGRDKTKLIGGPIEVRYHTYEDFKPGESYPMEKKGKSKGSFGNSILAPKEEYTEAFQGDNMEWVLSSEFDCEVRDQHMRIRAELTVRGYPTGLIADNKPATGAHHLKTIREGKLFEHVEGASAFGVLRNKVRGFASACASEDEECMARFLDNSVYVDDNSANFLSELSLPTKKCGTKGPFITIDIDIQEATRITKSGEVIENGNPFTLAMALGYCADFTFSQTGLARKLFREACSHVPEDNDVLKDCQRVLWAMMPKTNLDDLPNLGGGGGKEKKPRRGKTLEFWDIQRVIKLQDVPDYKSGDAILAFAWNLEHNRPATQKEVSITAKHNSSVAVSHLPSQTLCGLGLPNFDTGFTRVMDLVDMNQATLETGASLIDRDNVDIVKLKISPMSVLSDNGVPRPICPDEYEHGNPNCIPKRQINLQVTDGIQKLLTVTDVPKTKRSGPGGRGRGGGGDGGEFRPFEPRDPEIIGTLRSGDKHLKLNQRHRWVARVFQSTESTSAINLMVKLWHHMNELAFGLRDAELHSADTAHCNGGFPPKGEEYFDDYMDCVLNRQLKRIVAGDAVIDELADRITSELDKASPPSERSEPEACSA